MKSFLKIVIGGALVFQVVAIAQEWDYFSKAWFGAASSAPPLSDEETDGAAETIRQLLTSMEHFYGTGGDPRFSDRMPASTPLIDEMQADVDYLARNHRVQVPTLQRFELLEVRPLDEERIEVRTRELWGVRTLWSVQGSEAEPFRVQVVYGKYLVVRDRSVWRVHAWEPVESPSSRTGSAPGGM